MVAEPVFYKPKIITFNLKDIKLANDLNQNLTFTKMISFTRNQQNKVEITLFSSWWRLWSIQFSFSLILYMILLFIKMEVTKFIY